MNWNLNPGMEERSDILFSDLRIEKVEVFPGLEDSYVEYAELFNRIAVRIDEYLSEGAEREELVSDEDVDESILHLLRGDGGRGEMDMLYSRFYKYINRYTDFLDATPALHRALSNLGLSRNELIRWGDELDEWIFRPYFLLGNIGPVQFMGCSYLMVDRLWDVYQFVTKQHSDVYELTNKGCRLIGYTWQDYFRTLRYIPKAPMLFYDAVKSVVKGVPVIGLSTTDRINQTERTGAAFAEYPYKWRHDGSVEIRPLDISGAQAGSYIRRKYQTDEMKLDLNDRYGLAVALFDYKSKSGRIACLSFAGTRLGVATARQWKVMVQNGLTDIFQYFNWPSRTYFEAVAIVQEVMKTLRNRKVFVFGHSLGGGLMQYACMSLNDDRLYGVGYNSAGLSENTLRTIPNCGQEKMDSHIVHLCSLHDPVSRLGYVGPKVKYVKSSKGGKAHCLKQLNEKLNGGSEKIVRY